jgi:Type IV secretion system pilin
MRNFFYLFVIINILPARVEAAVVDLVTSAVQPYGVIAKPPLDIVSNIIAYSIGIAAILWVIGITWWGIEMVLSSGEDEKLKKGKYIMIYSIVGVVLAGLAYSIVTLMGNLRI